MSDDTREMMRDMITELEREYSDILNEFNKLKVEKARLRRFLLSLLRTVWISPEQAEEIISNVCDGKYDDALAGPERELHISPELIMNRDETRKSSFIGPSGAELVWNDMKKDDALAGPEKGTNNG